MATDIQSENSVLKTSPCGRWEKRNKMFSSKTFPCMENASLAMDTENGVEVVWIEIKFLSESVSEMERLKTVLDMVIHFNHPNVVKFHDYWIENDNDLKTVVFITESLACQSVNQLIKTGGFNASTLLYETWKRWCIQILLGIEYLHNRFPPFVALNLSTGYIFIQNNGSIKLALVHALTSVDVRPENILKQTNIVSESKINLLETKNKYTSFSRVFHDLYSFGHIALSLVTLENELTKIVEVPNFICNIEENSESSKNSYNYINIYDTICKGQLKKLKEVNANQANFLKSCIKLTRNRLKNYPTIRSLLMHSALFEVPSLKLLSGVICNANKLNLPLFAKNGIPGDVVLAKLYRIGLKKDDSGDFYCDYNDCKCYEKQRNDLPQTVSLEKFLGEVKDGLHPITCFQSDIITSQADLQKSVIDDLNDTKQLTSYEIDDQPLGTPVPFLLADDSSSYQEENGGIYITKASCKVSVDSNTKNLENENGNNYRSLLIELFLSDGTYIKETKVVNISSDTPKKLSKKFQRYSFLVRTDILLVENLIRSAYEHNVLIVVNQFNQP